MTSPTRHDASAFDINADFAALMKILQLDPKDTGGSIVFGGQDPVLQKQAQAWRHHEPRLSARLRSKARQLCLLMALFGHPTCTDECPLSGLKRT